MKNLFIILSLGLSLLACDEVDYLESGSIETTNGYVKGTLKGEMGDGTVVNESFNLEYSNPGNNYASTSTYNGSTTTTFNVSNSSSISESSKYSCSTNFDIRQEGNDEKLYNDFYFRLNRVLEGNKILSLSFTDIDNLGLTDFEYDRNSNNISGKITGQVVYSYYDDAQNETKRETFELEIEFDVNLWDKIE